MNEPKRRLFSNDRCLGSPLFISLYRLVPTAYYSRSLAVPDSAPEVDSWFHMEDDLMVTLTQGRIVPMDRGPWTAMEWPGGRVVIQSGDFTHDVALEVSGDFGDPAEKLAYATRLAGQMNSIEPVNQLAPCTCGATNCYCNCVSMNPGPVTSP
jgi:hypothetical protein